MKTTIFLAAVFLYLGLVISTIGYVVYSNKAAVAAARKKTRGYERWCLITGAVGFMFAPMFVVESLEHHNYLTILAAEFSLFFGSGLLAIGFFPFLRRMYKYNEKQRDD